MNTQNPVPVSSTTKTTGLLVVSLVLIVLTWLFIEFVPWISWFGDELGTADDVMRLVSKYGMHTEAAEGLTVVIGGSMCSAVMSVVAFVLLKINHKAAQVGGKVVWGAMLTCLCVVLDALGGYLFGGDHEMVPTEVLAGLLLLAGAACAVASFVQMLRPSRGDAAVSRLRRAKALRWIVTLGPLFALTPVWSLAWAAAAVWLMRSDFKDTKTTGALVVIAVVPMLRFIDPYNSFVALSVTFVSLAAILYFYLLWQKNVNRAQPGKNFYIVGACLVLQAAVALGAPFIGLVFAGFLGFVFQVVGCIFAWKVARGCMDVK